MYLYIFPWLSKDRQLDWDWTNVRDVHYTRKSIPLRHTRLRLSFVTPLMAMGDIKVHCHLLDKSNRDTITTEAFSVVLHADDTVEELKQAVRVHASPVLDAIAPLQLQVWQSIGTKWKAAGSRRPVYQNIDLFDGSSTYKLLPSWMKVKDFELEEYEMLFVKLLVSHPNSHRTSPLFLRLQTYSY